MTRWIAVLMLTLATSSCGVYGPPVRRVAPPEQSAPAPDPLLDDAGAQQDEESPK